MVALFFNSYTFHINRSIKLGKLREKLKYISVVDLSPILYAFTNEQSSADIMSETCLSFEDHRELIYSHDLVKKITL